MYGFQTLFKKEILRFWRVGFQTVAAPVLTALLYLLVFSHALSRHVEVYAGVSYTAFLISFCRLVHRDHRDHRT